MKSFMAKKEETKRGWVLIDVKDQIVGRAATEIATILRGKHRPTFTPHVDTGDFVVVVNAEHIKLSGKKWEDKIYYTHSGYMGGIKETPAEELKKKHPDQILMKAVKGMLPKNRLGRQLLKKLKIYAGQDHPHASQQPEVKELNT